MAFSGRWVIWTLGTRSLSNSNLEDLVSDFLRLYPKSSAKTLSAGLGVPVSEINSNLYKWAGVRFLRESERPPLWKLVEQEVSGSASNPKPIRVNASNPLEISWLDETWTVTIQVGYFSVNDAIAEVEVLGFRSRLITVSATVDPQVTLVRDGEPVPMSVLAIAASALAWEIFHHCEVEKRDAFDFGLVMRDVYRSLMVISQ
jgi:hypothetical protein